eukprot:TRINITY_DN10827_c0_g1_i4.p3 TRINITY_DN10827_c0_g1~~TRINITY_DN10827_c0_g1_i4.p3  ORF type:complete len:214 (+),score=28.16 TRINITY_DN10827_c0_g1_i4:1897-2538(+)
MLPLRTIDLLKFSTYPNHATLWALQLDFQMPQRFELEFKARDGSLQRPVMIHRAVLGRFALHACDSLSDNWLIAGSFERMIAVLTEHYGGRWPLRLSPRQCLVLPIAERHRTYASTVKQELEDVCYVDIDDSAVSLAKRIAANRNLAHNLVLVIGDEEVENKTVALRHRDTKVIQSGDLSEVQKQQLEQDSFAERSYSLDELKREICNRIERI